MAFLGNYEEFFGYVTKHYDDLFLDNDMLEQVSVCAMEGGYKDFAVSLFTRYEQNLAKSLDDPDESFLENSINFYKDYAHDFEKVAELLEKGIELEIYFGNYLMEDAVDMLSTNGLRDRGLQILWKYIEKDENVSRRIMKNYLRNFEAKEGVGKMEAEIDRILEHWKIKLASEGVHRDRTRRTLLSEVTGDASQRFRPDSLVSAKGIQSFRDKFMSNDYRGRQELGHDYREPPQMTSVSNIVDPHEAGRGDGTSLRLFQIFSQNTAEFDTQKTREEIDDFFQSRKIAIKTVTNLEDLDGAKAPSKDEESETHSLFALFEVPDDDSSDMGFFSLMDREEDPKPKTKPKAKAKKVVVDLLSPDFKNKIIFSDTSEQEKHKKFYDGISQGKSMVHLLVYTKAKYIALTKGTKPALDYLASNRFVFYKEYTRILFKFYKKCLDIDEIMQLEGRFFGIIKRLYFDKMNIKKVASRTVLTEVRERSRESG